MIVLEVRDVHAYYGLGHVLQGVTLDVGEHEIVGLFGRNGVGKTTILRCIAGWLAPRRGSVRLRGTELSRLRAERIARLGVAYVPEDRRIFPGLSVEENLLLGMLQRARGEGPPRREALGRIYERFPRLAERRRQPGTTLSGGEQQMLTIARALIGAPRLLLIDEPTEGLAPMIVEDIFRILAELRGEGLSVVLVEQKVARALEVVDRFYAVQRGQVVLAGASGSEEDRNRLLEAVSV